jgi:transcriptional regulator with XRE-family HTH domain
MWCMAGTTKGSPQLRILGAWLRDAREAKKLGVRELARQLGIEHANLSRWETAERQPRPEDVSMVLTAVGVSGDDRERLVDFARGINEPNWLTLGDSATSEALTALIQFESMAASFAEWSPLVIPGMAQTGDYARAIMRDGGVSTGEINARVAVRLSRRDVLTRQEPIHFHALVGAEALRQVIGGVDIMAAQLRYLLEFSKIETVTLQLVPTGHGWHPGLAGPFELLRFPTGRPIVHFEHFRSSLFLYEDESDLQAYGGVVTTMSELAMSPEDSASYIADAISELER